MYKFLFVFFFTFFSFSAHAQENNLLEKLKTDYKNCNLSFEKSQNECPDSWSMKCYNHLVDANKNLQNCYKNIAVKLFINFYGLSENDAEKKFNDYADFIYKQFFFIFSETSFCQKNNCGVSIYLYSEYATSHQTAYFVNKIINSLEARD